MNFISSFSILFYLAGGLAVGWFVFPKKWLRINNKIITVGIVLVLFFMGVSLGASPTLLQDLRDAGAQALVLAAGAVIGSVLLVELLARVFFGGKKK